jgi:hypothetical protein
VPADYIVIAIHFTGRTVFRPRSIDLLGCFQASYYDRNRPIFRVPSVIVPHEYNYILFPEVHGFAASIVWTEPLSFDTRLFYLIDELREYSLEA